MGPGPATGKLGQRARPSIQGATDSEASPRGELGGLAQGSPNNPLQRHVARCTCCIRLNDCLDPKGERGRSGPHRSKGGPRGVRDFFWKALLLIRITQNGRRPAPYGAHRNSRPGLRLGVQQV